MSRHIALIAALLSFTALGAAGSCSPGAEPGEQRAGAGRVVAHFGDTTITQDDLDTRIAAELYEARSTALETLISERVVEAEATRRGIDPNDLLDTILAEVPPVGDEDVAAFYQENRARMGPEDTLETIGDRIRGFLEHQRRTDVMQSLIESAGVSILLQPPRAQVAATGPSTGPPEAPVTIIEFSDYQCPFCRRVEPTLQEVLRRYPDQVRLVYRHFPLDAIHPRARRAAEAAACADRQGQFWAFHATLFESAGKLEESDLVGYAGEMGLDLEAFETCRASDEIKELVQKDLSAGQEVGATGTPAFFVNGIMLTGARPLEDFISLIESELENSTEADSG